MKFILPNNLKLKESTNFSSDVIKWSTHKYVIKYISIESIWVLEFINKDIMLKKPLEESNHFKYLNGNKQPYFDMIIRGKFCSNYSDLFDNLINNFTYLQNGHENDYIITYAEGDKHIILDGCHRAALLKKQGYTIIPVVIVEF